MAVFNEPTKWQTSLVNSGDANTIPQSTPVGTGEASFEEGFPQITQVPIGAGGQAPDRKDFNGLFKVLGDSIFYMQNGGLPTYSENFDYVAGRVVLYNDNIYKCIQANGVSSTVVAPDSASPLGSDYWKDIENQDSTSLIPNQLIVSPIPLTDANLHLLDGALLSGSGAYSAYVSLIADLYNGGTASSSFCTEAEWQTSNTNYGFCNKFVYDSVANTVRLPKVNTLHGKLINSNQTATNWHRKYEDGWVEQGGFVAGVSDIQTVTVNMPLGFSDTNYNISLTRYVRVTSATDISGTIAALNVSTKTANTFKVNGYTNGFYWSACGYTDISDLQTAPIYEYIVVGTISKTDIQIDIDNILADLALKADKNLSNAVPTNSFATALNNVNIRTVVEDYVNGASWYRVYSDGFCVQGGSIPTRTTSVSLLKEYRDNTYQVFCDYSLTPSSEQATNVLIGAISTGTQTTSSFTIGPSSLTRNWVAYGFVS